MYPICFIIHLIPLVLRDLFICRKFGKNGAKYEHRRQVDVAEGYGPTWPRRLMPCGVSWPPCGPATSLIRERGSTRLHHHWFNVDLINGQDGAVLDPWAHCHPLERLQPTSKPPFCPNNRLTCHATAIWRATKALRSRGGGIQRQPTP
jgi:hypothetical protein